MDTPTDAKRPNPSKPLLTPGLDDPMSTEDFISEFTVEHPEPVIEFYIETGRKVDHGQSPFPDDAVAAGPPQPSEPNNTQTPDPTLTAYAHDGGHIISLSLSESDSVFYAIWTDMDLTPVLLRVVRSIDDEYDGIKSVREFNGTGSYTSIQQAVELLVEAVSDSP